MDIMLRICPLLLCGSLAAAGATKCDDLTPSRGGAGYRIRGAGDRCEGEYEMNRSFPSVTLAGFYAAPFAFQPGIGRTVVLHWKSNEALHLRASSVVKNFFYRMDSDRPAAESSYEWKLELLAQLDRGAQDIALVAFSGSVGKNEVYYPLISGEQHPDGQLRFTFLNAAKNTESLEFSGCALQGASLALSKPIRKNGPFERSERVDLNAPVRSGRSCLQVAARYSGGGSQIDSFLLQVP